MQLLLSCVFFCIFFATLCVSPTLGQVTSQENINGSAGSGSTLEIRNNVNGNIFTTTNGGTDGLFVISVDITGDAQSDVDSVTVTWTQTATGWLLKVDGPLTGGGKNGNSSAGNRVAPSVIMFSIIAAFLAFFVTPSAKLRILLIAAIAIFAGASVYAGNVKADVTVYLPPDVANSLGTVILGGIGSGSHTCDGILTNCGTVVSSDAIDGYWLFSSKVVGGSTTATYDSSNICLGSGGSCTPGIICIQAGGLDKWVFNSSASSYIHYTNVQTGSDFNTAGDYLIYSNGIIVYHKLRDWSCAHPEPLDGGQEQYDTDDYYYGKYKVVSPNIRITDSGGNIPTDDSEPDSYTEFRPITQLQLYNDYTTLSPSNGCQECKCICISGGSVTVSTYPDSNYGICNSCIITCRSQSNGDCICTCAHECKDYEAIQNGPFLANCPSSGRRTFAENIREAILL